ncbi:MAG: DUF362 domain-containing protein [Actinomycetia bacterium]|nr:DUF362 domain-containing protein [Actinomycetes bacterium]
MASPTPTQEEREIIIRDKAAREGLTVPDDVIQYIALHRTTDQALKSALINLSAYAYRKQTPITLQMAEYVLEGVRTGISVKHAAELTREIPAVTASELTFGVDETVKSKSSSASFGLPSFLAGGTSPMAEALTDEREIVLEDVPEYQHVDDVAVHDVVVDGTFYKEEGVKHVAIDDIEPLHVEESIIEEPFIEEPIVEEPAFEALSSIEIPEPLVEDEIDDPVWAVESIGEMSAALREEALEFEEPLYEEPVYVGTVEEDIQTSDATLFDSIDDAFSESVQQSTMNFSDMTFDEVVSSLAGEPVVAELTVTPEASGPASEVFFAPMRTTKKRSLVERAGIALQKAGLDEVISEGDLVAIKLHVGEAGNSGFVNPIFIREVVSLIKELGGKPFLTDANTLYSGQRRNAVDHMSCAVHNGFSFATVEAPFIVADGLLGHDWTDVVVDGKHCESVRMGTAAVEADAMVVVSHVKGHGVAGFGGAIKNVGMGLGARSAKQRMHSDVKPEVNAAECSHCYKCIKWCPAKAITVNPDTRAAVIDHEVCYGCGECVAACNYGAIAISLETDPNVMQEKMIEHAAGIIKSKPDKMIYLSLLTNITPECDCWSYSDAPIVGDIGLMASRDMIAIDQAAYDMIVDAVGTKNSVAVDMGAGSDKFTEISGTNGTHAIEYGEEFGLGTRNYHITEIG